jgi:hypothetical protein
MSLFIRWVRKLSGPDPTRTCRWRSSPAARQGRRVSFRPRVRYLEGRTLLSTIIWTDRGSPTNDSDGFNAVFGANAETGAGDIPGRAALVERRPNRPRKFGSSTFPQVRKGDRIGLGNLNPF